MEKTAGAPQTLPEDLDEESALSSHRVKMVIGLAILVSALGYFALMAFQSATVYFYTVDEIVESAQHDPGNAEGTNVDLEKLDRKATFTQLVAHAAGGGKAATLEGSLEAELTLLFTFPRGHGVDEDGPDRCVVLGEAVLEEGGHLGFRELDAEARLRVDGIQLCVD